MQRIALDEVASKLLENAGVSGPPVDLEKIRRVQSVVGVQEVRLGPVLGCTIARPEGFIIKLNSQAPLKKRFTYAHELAHTVLDGNHRLVGRRGISLRTDRKGIALERECDRLAGEMLMPRRWVSRWLSTRPVNIKTVLDLADAFETSVESAAVRFGQLARSSFGLICWKALDNELVVSWTGGLTSLATKAIPPSKSLSRLRDSSAVHAFDCDHPVIAVVSRPSTARRMYSESVGFGERAHRYVLTLIKPGGSATALESLTQTWHGICARYEVEHLGMESITNA